MKFVPYSLTDEHNSTQLQLVKTSVRPVRPLLAFSVALLLEISLGCFSMILRQNARVQSVEQNYHWVSLAKAQGENNVDHFIWQTEFNSQKSELEGKTTDCEFWVQVLEWLMEQILSVRMEYRQKGSWCRFHDNTPAHSAIRVKHSLAHHSMV